MSDNLLSASERKRGLTAVTVALAAVSLIHGLTLPMFALVLEHHGVDKATIGINTAGQYLAVFAAAPFVSMLMGVIGPALLMFWSVIAAALIFMLLPLHVDVYLWFVLRFALGIAQSFLWIAGEAWVSHLAEDSRRGRIVAIYGTVTAVGFAAGPLLLSVLGTDGWAPFMAAAVLTFSGALPLALVLKGAPKLRGTPSGSFLRYALLSPVATSVYFVFAACDAVMLTFLPLYALNAGLPEWISITLLTAMAVGAIASQYPVGHLADRVNGMMLTTVAVLLLIVGFLLVPSLLGTTPLNFIWMFVIGCSIGALYTLPLVFIGRRFKGADLGPAATARNIVFCVGSMAGPAAIGIAMQSFGPHALPYGLAILLLVLLPLPLIGWRKDLLA